MSTLATWLGMVEADRVITGQTPLTDEELVLTYSGNGASVDVTIGDLWALLDRLATLEQVLKAAQAWAALRQTVMLQDEPLTDEQQEAWNDAEQDLLAAVADLEGQEGERSYE